MFSNNKVCSTDWKASAYWDTQCLWASVPKKCIHPSGLDGPLLGGPSWHNRIPPVTCSVTLETPGPSHPKALVLLYYHKSPPCECHVRNKANGLHQHIKAASPPGLKETYPPHSDCWSFCLPERMVASRVQKASPQCTEMAMISASVSRVFPKVF